MKRVRIAPGKFVVIPAELAEKAARVYGAGLTRDQVRDLSPAKMEVVTGLMAGSPKPLAIARHSLSARPKSVGTLTRKIPASSVSRRKTG